MLTTAPVLAYPRFGPGQDFILETDGSVMGLGAVLSQEQEDGFPHPIAYASHPLNQHEKNYGISELETLGLVWAVRYFRPYLLGHHCTVYTDHTACLSILNTSMPSGKLARWALTIQEMDLTLKHKPGRKNSNADALSRSPAIHQVSCENLHPTEEIPLTIPDGRTIRDMQMSDAELCAWMSYLQDGVLPEDNSAAQKIVLECKSKCKMLLMGCCIVRTLFVLGNCVSSCLQSFDRACCEKLMKGNSQVILL